MIQQIAKGNLNLKYLIYGLLGIIETHFVPQAVCPEKI
jgi:hypothetical protein